MSISKRLITIRHTGPHPLASWKSDAEWKATQTTPEPITEEIHVFDIPRPQSSRPSVRRSRLHRDDQLELPGFGPGPDTPEDSTSGLANGLAHHPDHHRPLLPELRPTQDIIDHEPIACCAISGWVRVGRVFMTPAHMVPGPERDRIERFLSTATQEQHA